MIQDMATIVEFANANWIAENPGALSATKGLLRDMRAAGVKKIRRSPRGWKQGVSDSVQGPHAILDMSPKPKIKPKVSIPRFPPLGVKKDAYHPLSIAWHEGGHVLAHKQGGQRMPNVLAREREANDIAIYTAAKHKAGPENIRKLAKNLDDNYAENVVGHRRSRR